MEPSPSSPGSASNYHPTRSSSMHQYADQRQESPPPLPRTSIDSNSTKVHQGRREGEPQSATDVPDDVVPTNFDEVTIKMLSDMDCGVACMLDRIKQGMASCREAAVFLHRRAALEEELGRSLNKLAVTSVGAYAANECKAGSFASAWENAMHVHEIIADNRLKFAANLSEMGDELSLLAREVDKSRKIAKDLHSRLERQLQEAEMATDKARAKVDGVTEELERFLVAKEGENMKESRMQAPGTSGPGKKAMKAVVKGGLLLKGRNPEALQRQEKEIRTRIGMASDAYRKLHLETQTLRQEYFNLQLPKIIKTLKEANDEVDTGMQFHLTRYAYLFESSILSDGITLVPKGIEDGPGLKPIMESIDNRSDFRTYVHSYKLAHHGQSRGPRREGPADQGFLPPLAPYGERSPVTNYGGYNNNRMDRPNATFGVDLTEQMDRDGVEVPKILQKCCEAVEKYGMDIQGIYRISGTHTKVSKLKELLDRDVDSVDLDSDEWISDINNVSSVLKQWLRELPDPLFTSALYAGFIEAAKNENDRLRHIRLHERVNDLPDANYATLKYLMGHLHKVATQESVNSMGYSNIAIVFGPTLFGNPPASAMPNPAMVNGIHNGAIPGMGPPGGAGVMGDMNFQYKAVETILERYQEIFVEE